MHRTGDGFHPGLFKYIVAVMLLFFLVQPVYLDCILQPTRIYKLGRYVLMKKKKKGGGALYYLRRRFKTSLLEYYGAAEPPVRCGEVLPQLSVSMLSYISKFCL